MQNLRMNTVTISLILMFALSLSACHTVKSPNNKVEELRQDDIIRNHFSNCKRKQSFKTYKGTFAIDTIDGSPHLFYDSINIIFYNNNSKRNELFYNGIITRKVLNLSPMDTIFVIYITDVSGLLEPNDHQRSFKILYADTKFSYNPYYIFITIKSKEKYNNTTLKAFIKKSKLTFASEVFIQI